MNDHNIQRTRTFSWQDPMEGTREGRKLSGLEYLKAMQRGELPMPPIFAMTGGDVETVEEGKVSFRLEPAEYHYNPIGAVHGGVACTFLDSAMACAVHSTLDARVGYTTLEIKVNFVRPMSVGTGPVIAEGRVVHVGGRVATAEGRIVDARGKIYAHATETCLIMKPKGV